MNKEKPLDEKIEELKEEGVWIVYDLEANRRIQNLLQKEGFSFRFDPSLDILRRDAQKIFSEKIKLAKQCLNFKGFHCDNKDCKNKFCPLCEEGKK